MDQGEIGFRGTEVNVEGKSTFCLAVVNRADTCLSWWFPRGKGVFFNI